MNFFDRELKRLLENKTDISDVKFVGRVCYGRISDKLRVRIEFVTIGIAEHYEALKATIINRNDGSVDVLTLRFSDILGKKPVVNPNFKDGICPYIWRYGEKTEWYIYTPTEADFRTIREALNNYIDVFREQTQEIESGMTISHS